MANHSPEPDNYVGKKTWDEAMNGGEAQKPESPTPSKGKGKGGAAKNGGGGDK